MVWGFLPAGTGVQLQVYNRWKVEFNPDFLLAKRVNKYDKKERS